MVLTVESDYQPKNEVSVTLSDRKPVVQQLACLHLVFADFRFKRPICSFNDPNYDFTVYENFALRTKVISKQTCLIQIFKPQDTAALAAAALLVICLGDPYLCAGRSGYAEYVTLATADIYRPDV